MNNRNKSEVNVETVSKILFEIWDPLNVNGSPKLSDEYSDFAPDLVKLINSGATSGQLTGALNALLVRNAGLPPHERSALAAKALVRLRDQR